MILRILLMVVLAVPLARKFPYLLHAWRSSPLDSWDVVFWLAALVWTVTTVGWEWRRTGYDFKATTGGHHHGLNVHCLVAGTVILGCLGVWWLAEEKNINAIAIVAGVTVLGGGVWLNWGWSWCEKLLPALFLAVLGCPSSSYWTEYYFGLMLGIPWLSGFEMKLLAGIGGGTVWLVVKTYWRRSVSLPGAVFFAAAVLVSILLLTGTNSLPPGKSVRLDLTLKRGAWLGKAEALTPLDQSFFAGCRASRMIYFNAASYVSVLYVKPQGNIHQIHPIGICLRSVGNEVISQRQVLVPELQLQCEQLTVVINRKQYLIYAWFVCPEYSTGNFKLFRSNWRPDRNWQVYQMMTPVDGNKNAAQKRLREFILTFRTAAPRHSVVSGPAGAKRAGGGVQ
ncbi:MAG: hypothetical protein PHQ27_07690 [Victivallales bacterium]|nr:hypothetical protein [Victivallales bacterium]